MSTWRSMIGANAEPPSGQWSASLLSGDVMEIVKLLVFVIGITLTACGFYHNIWRRSAVQSQASPSPNSSPPHPTQFMGVPGPVEMLNSIEGSLEDVLMSVVSSNNNSVPGVPDSTNPTVVVLEMASLTTPLPA